jgi:acyl carrier protein
MTKDDHFERLKEFVIKQSYVDDEPITEQTSLENDLGVTGADALEFIVAYGTFFNVDVSNFMAADYFNAEGESLFFRAKMKSFTVGHLLNGILAGRLDEEVINS